jgi:predicted amidohydrolase YtcJ
MRDKPDNIILSGGKVVTLDPQSTVAESLVVSDGRILAIGNDDEMAQAAGPEAKRIDLAGRSAIPGLIDGHAHMDREGLKLQLPSLAGAASVDDILERIAALARNAEPGEWIVTMPIGDPPYYSGVPGILREGRVPTRDELDRAAPDNPVYIRAIWGHWRNTLPLVSIANSEALRRANVTRDTIPPVATIQIDKDHATGEPTGVFHEFNYKPIVEHTLMSVIPRFTLEDRIAGLRDSMRIYNAVGTTSVFEGHGIAAEVLAAYQALRDEGPTSVRAHLMFSPSWPAPDSDVVGGLLDSWGAWLSGRGLGDEYLRAGGLYTESDYSEENLLRAETSPYSGWAGFNYDACLPEEVMVDMMIDAARHDIRIGSFTPNILDLYEKVDRAVPIGDKRWVIEHVGVLSADEIARIRDLGLVLTVYTGRYVYQEGAMLARELGDSADQIAPLRSLLEAGVHVSLATDNVPPSMFHPVWHATSRIAEETGVPVAPAQCISREEALACASREGAYLTFEEKSKGTLEPGKFADIAVLSDDPLTIDEERIQDIVAELVLVGGEVVYDRADAAKPSA